MLAFCIPSLPDMREVMMPRCHRCVVRDCTHGKEECLCCCHKGDLYDMVIQDLIEEPDDDEA